MFGGDLLCRSLHSARAAVITEAAPDPEQILFRCSGQTIDTRESFQEPLVVGHDGRHAGLLQHDFRDPDAVGVFGAPPREIALVAAVPAQQGLSKALSVVG